ncbi:two-component sensor histidine kinase [Calothrix parasitica NIES-267]|uniref:histidine kinase n=1 Tax=Calothrix parasitica NIES-267 TaxID=1973488 RepID=A0A1Z4LL51_9CYAN|nr:two-component sensor histidine kinase [Calothrix parasitica NIES-267]
MEDFSQPLLDNKEKIIETWLKQIREDSRIKSTDGLSKPAIIDHLDHVLVALVTVLSRHREGSLQTIVEASLNHGVLRAEQGFEASEIAREYHLFRQAIFSTLEGYFLISSPLEIIENTRLINSVVDEAIARCFDSYTQQRIEELENLQNQLTLHNQELTRFVRTSQENMSFLAHELKSPLTSIIGYSDLFLRIQRQKDEVKNTYGNLEHIEQVLNSGRKLLCLINNALEISRLSAGESKLNLKSINPSLLIEEVNGMLKPSLGTKDIEIILNFQKAPERVVTDALKLQQVITNILSNAIRYTESGKIEITCKTVDDSKWGIIISDTGIGISEEDLSNIFNPYYRANPEAESCMIDGTGLGLAIVSQLIEVIKGKIEVDSVLGNGSIFTITLPLEIRLTVISEQLSI